MEVAKKNRTQQRRLFTKACNEFDAAEADLEASDKIIKLKIIEEKAMLMLTSEENVKQLLYSDGKANDALIEQEIDESEIYIDRWRLLQLKLQQLSLIEREEISSNCSVSQQNTLLHYPKIQLPTFNGDIRCWVRFWGQFEKVDKDHNLDAHDKFAYLSQCMEKGSVAEELIKSFPPGGNSYEKAIEQLKLRYGREELLIQVYVRDLLSLVLQKQNMPKKSLRNLYDLLETKLRALEILGVTRDKYAAMLFPLVESALPEETLLAWERFRSTSRRSFDEENQNSKATTKTDLDSILEFLQDEVQAEERIILASQNFGIDTKPNFKSFKEKKAENNKHKYGDTRQIASAADLLTSSKEQRQCIFCRNLHNSTDCLKVRKMSIKDRVNLVEKSGCCFLCLKPGHQVRKCYSKVTCLGCEKRHHILLCHNIKQQTILPTGKEISEIESSPNGDQALANVSKSPNVMLLTLTVLIRGNGKKRKARAIIDTASQRSYILKSTAKEMKYVRENWEYLQHSLFGGENTGVCKHDVFTLYLTSYDGSYNCHFKVLSQPVICESFPPTMPAIHLEELTDYDIHVNDDYNGPIEILIGADVAGKIITGGYKSLPCGLTAMETRLGWTIMGRIPRISPEENGISVASCMLSTTRTITELWTLDSLGITDPSEKKAKEDLHERAREHFIETVQVDKDNRFVVHLPWLEDHPPLPDNFNLALKRLESTARKLKEENLYDDYNQVFEEWAKEGIIEEVPKHEIHLPAHYLPHRHVVKENSTTRIRPVFDASAKVKASPSLNDCLEKGTNLVESIPTVLARFRMNKFGVTADIRKAFLQISLQENDKNFLRFLWYNENKELKYFRHCRVVFGICSSPFLLNSVIQYHLDMILEEAQTGYLKYPAGVVEKLKNSFYVDNCLTSLKTEAELHEFIRVAKDVMQERKFDLRGWEHNYSHSSTEEASCETNKIVPLLGLQWSLNTDTLSVNLKEGFEDNGPVTKRKILSEVHKIFDPIGYTCPVTLYPKLLLQELWQMKTAWDAELPPEICKKFKRWRNQLTLLKEIAIPRCFIKDPDDTGSLSIHVFCDASKTAYATCIYLRSESNNSTSCQLIQARSKIAPLKAITIPRLELLACSIGTRLVQRVIEDLQLGSIPIFFWTDSSTALCWIKGSENWTPFVYNRVREIRLVSKPENWNYVPGSINPADLPSRGCSARQLLETEWWHGPPWLCYPSDKWPRSEFSVNEEEVLKEKKKEIVSSMVSLQKIDNSFLYKFSRYNKTVRIVAWILRFISNSRIPRNARKYKILDSEEISRAELAVIKMIQSESFINEEDEKLKTLGVFKDKNGIIRLKTKILYRPDSEDFKTPAILPSKNELVKRIVIYYHIKNAHAGTQMLLNILRERFWILHGRKTVRSILSKCVICKRHSAKKLDTLTAPLPEDRIREAAVFEICGIDLAGPLFLKDNNKSWVCLFTCAVYRAVHIELVASLSTQSFLLALRRFIARRGRCNTIYCDNGSNFVGTANLLSALDWNLIVSDTALHPIKWKFNPPTASWWGGWWERLIGILKRLLRRVLGRSSLTYEQMTTVLCDCEAIINSRPMTYVTDNDAELVPLTPSMFLQDIKVSGVPDFDRVDHQSLNQRVKYRQNLQIALRNRFRSEYLGALLQKPDHCKTASVAVGDVVLIGSDNMKRISWPLGKIIEVMPGKDSVTRLVRLKTERGELLRPIQRLYPLEVSAAESVLIKKLPSTKSSEKPTVSHSVDCNVEPSEQERKTRSGRIIRMPLKLDL